MPLTESVVARKYPKGHRYTHEIISLTNGKVSVGNWTLCNIFWFKVNPDEMAFPGYITTVGVVDENDSTIR